MATQFYLTVPSNSSLEYFPNSTMASFKVKLAELIELKDVQFVGGVKVPLLRIVNSQGNYGDNVNASFRYMQYVPIKVKSFETIEINIKDDKNENVSFENVSIFHLKMRHTYSRRRTI